MISIVYGANYFETEETIEDNSSQYCDSAIQHSMGLKLEKVYEEDGSYYADVTVVDNDKDESDEKLSCSEESGKYISGYSVANDIASKELPIRYNFTEDGYGLINVRRIVEYPDTATCKCNIISGLKNGDKLKILITELSYDVMECEED